MWPLLLNNHFQSLQIIDLTLTEAPFLQHSITEDKKTSVYILPYSYKPSQMCTTYVPCKINLQSSHISFFKKDNLF